MVFTSTADFYLSQTGGRPINNTYGRGMSLRSPGRPASISVRAAAGNPHQRVDYMSMVRENLRIEQGNAAAKVIINSQHGHIVKSPGCYESSRCCNPWCLNGDHHRERSGESAQCTPLPAGQTTITPARQINIEEGDSRNVRVQPGVKSAGTKSCAR